MAKIAAKAAKPFQPVIATANDLRRGDVVFRAADGAWTRDVSRAEVADSADAAVHLQAAADADFAANRIVDPALIAVTREAGLVRPVALREIIRASGGPTIELPQGGSA